MAREIIYDRRFIKINDDCYIPIIQHGSSNCWEHNQGTGREVAEKNWFNIGKIKINETWQKKIYYTVEELKALAKQWDKYESYKTRNNPFKPGEFEKWFLNGVKSAMSIEDYAKHGITVMARIDAYLKPGYNHIWHTTHISQNNLIDISIQYLKNHVEQKHINADEADITIYFEGRDCMKLLPKKNKPRTKKLVNEYYIIGKETPKGNLYIYQKTPIRFVFATNKHNAKKFKTYKEAERWYEKYKHKLTEGWNVIQVEGEAYL